MLLCLFDCLCVPKTEFHLSSFNCMYVLGVNCIHLYGKLVLCTLVYKTSLQVNNNERNITKVRLCELCVKCVQTVAVQVYTKPVNCTSVYKTVCKLVDISLNKLKVDN